MIEALQHLAVMAPWGVVLFALGWRTERQRSAHRKIAALKDDVVQLKADNTDKDERILKLENLIRDPHVVMEARLKYAEQLRIANR